MRGSFIETLCDLAQSDERIWLLTGDLGFSVLEPFAERFGGRFVNAGVAEQNMTGVAAGLAHSGKIVFTYSIANFPTLRCLEQIRNDVCYLNLNVNIVAVGGGLAYGSAGYTHHGIEDLAIMRNLPGMTVIAPADRHETKSAVRLMVETDGPCYLRLGKSIEPDVHDGDPDMRFGKVIPLREGRDALIVATGVALDQAVKAADLCHADGIEVAVWSCPFVSPIDEEAMAQAASNFKVIMTVEEARPTGGLGGAVAEIISQQPGDRARVIRAGVCDDVIHNIGDRDYLRDRCGLTAKKLKHTVINALKK
jgi:transketolase